MNRNGTLGRVATVIALVCLLAGCGAMAPQYPANPNEPTNLTPVEEGGVSLSLPPGWSVAAADPGNPRVKARFSKTDGSRLVVLCQSPILRRVDDARITVDGMRSAFANSWQTRGPFALGGSINSPVIEGWLGNVTKGGQEVGLAAFVAYNMESVPNWCKYQMMMFGAPSRAAELEAEFVAIVRSLKR